MPYATTDDGVRLWYEETGSGSPVLFIHEFAGDHRSWAPQVRRFAPEHRCITYAARGYPPSEVPTEPSAYSQAQAVEDACAVLDASGADSADVVGLSMGGFAALHLAMLHPDRVRSAVVAGVGYGAQPERREAFRADAHAIADAFESEGSQAVAARYAVGPARVQLQNKNPQAWADFAAALAGHDARGAALTMRGVQAERQSLYELTDQLRAMRTPVLIIAGDEDDGSIEPSLMLKRTIPTSGLLILPRTGHTLNLEGPDAFNDAIAEFIAAVESGVWHQRDPRSLSSSLLPGAIGQLSAPPLPGAPLRGRRQAGRRRPRSS
jgi:pimeloyl-ACP methyl ester carboxylesterase